MAVINSLAIGRSVKSAGNLTYKTVRGRTIASQRITQNKSNTPKQQSQRSLFGNSNLAMQLVLPWINNFFQKSKLGSSRNQFLSLCKSYTMGGLAGEVREGIISLYEGFLLGIGVSESGDKLLHTQQFTSYGNAPVIVSGTRKIKSYTSTVSVGATTYYQTYTNLNFALTQGVKDTDIELLVLGFIKETNIEQSPLQFFDLTLSDEDLATVKVYGAEVVVTKDNNGIVSNINVKPYGNEDPDASQNVLIVVPRIAGKVPTTQGVFTPELKPLP